MVETRKADMEKSFDTLASSQRLRETGMPMEQADATANVVANAIGSLVTREYLDTRLESLEIRIDARFAKVDASFTEIGARFTEIGARFTRTDARIDSLRADMGAQQARWALTIVLSQIAVAGLLFALLTYTG